MGNANGREDDPSARSNGAPAIRDIYAPNLQPPVRGSSSDLMAETPPQSPGGSRSPLLFNPQDTFKTYLLDTTRLSPKPEHSSVPIAPLPRNEGLSFLSQNKPIDPPMNPTEGGIPTMITWTYGGNDVSVEGSWDNWSSRKLLQRTGKDHSILLVLPSGIYHYKFIVDGERRYIPELPHIEDATGRLCNLLDVNDYVPENPESIAEFDLPASPDCSYSQLLPTEEDFAKEPALVPSHLQLTVLGSDEEGSSSRPQHVMLNHLFIEKGCAASQSMVALGLTHRFKSKYVTVVLYKPLKR